MSFLTPSSSSYISIRTYNVSFQGIGSVREQKPDGSYTEWVSLNNKNIELLSGGKKNKTVHGFGGASQTVEFIVPDLPVFRGAPVKIEFRFDRHNGITTAYKVLDVNFLSGKLEKLAKNSLSPVDYSALPVKFKDPSLIGRGQGLWLAKELREAPGGRMIKARCASCHFFDGSDLKFFGFSPEAIANRAAFHGFSKDDQDALVAFIANLPTPRRANPWDPPFQPGPGLDSRPIEAWMAGAGIDAVAKNPDDILPAIVGADGAQAKDFHYNTSLNAREVPLPYELPDWNSYLPTVHPEDLVIPHTDGVVTDDSNDLLTVDELAFYKKMMDQKMFHMEMTAPSATQQEFLGSVFDTSATYAVEIWHNKFLDKYHKLAVTDTTGLKTRKLLDVNKLFLVKFLSAAHKAPAKAFLHNGVKRFPEQIHHAIFFRVAPFEGIGGNPKFAFRDLPVRNATDTLNLQWWSTALQGYQTGGGEQLRWNYVSTAFPFINNDLGASSALILFFKKMVEEVVPVQSFNFYKTPLQRVFNFGTEDYLNAHPQLVNAMTESIYSNYVDYGGAEKMMKFGRSDVPEDVTKENSRNSFYRLLMTFQPGVNYKGITVVNKASVDNLWTIYRQSWPEP